MLVAIVRARRSVIVTPYITGLYAGLLALLFAALSLRVIARRRSTGVALGFGGRPDLERATRAQANFAEYVPLSLMLMLVGETSGLPAWALHIAGLSLLLGRVVHAFGVSRDQEDFRFRVTGMALTLTVILLLGIIAIARGFGLMV
ncbi:MAG: MAPEG family protein [Sphingomonadaceae bacterium]|nr:MAPEG family protein [Sphingomonadaceae bacterium]